MNALSLTEAATRRTPGNPTEPAMPCHISVPLNALLERLATTPTPDRVRRRPLRRDRRRRAELVCSGG